MIKSQLTKEEAIIFHDSKVYENWSLEQVATFQLFQEFLCVPFNLFHESIEKILNRPVFTHEFAEQERLIKEYLKLNP